MELKGRKQTEVGTIPEEWNVQPLRALAEIHRGASPRPIASPVWYDHASTVGWVRISDVTASDGKRLRKTVDYLSRRGIANSRFLPAGSLIMSICATVGIPVITEIDSCIHDGFVGFTRLRHVDQEFLYYKLKELEPRFRAMGQTGSQSNLNSDLVRNCLVALPGCSEQRAIAAALADVDTLISTLDQLIVKKRNLKQAAAQPLLTGQTRLPGFSGEWQSVRFSDIADKAIPWSIGGGPFGSNLKTSDYTAEGVRIIQLQNIGDGRFHDDYAIYTSQVKADELLSNNIYPGEIILSKMGDPVARACFVPNVDRRYLMASDGIRLAVDSRRFDKRFVHDYINSVYFRQRAIEASTGSTRQRIGLLDLKQLPFAAPPLAEQTAIAVALSDMDAELAALERRLDKTRALKEGMMQELLTGRTRLA